MKQWYLGYCPACQKEIGPVQWDWEFYKSDGVDLPECDCDTESGVMWHTLPVQDGAILTTDEREEDAVQTIQIEGSLAAKVLQASDATPHTARSDGDHA